MLEIKQILMKQLKTVKFKDFRNHQLFSSRCIFQQNISIIEVL